MDLKAFIRDVPDFPKKGILFKDITTLWKDKDAFKEVINIIVDRYKDKGIDKVVCAEARGFVIGGAIAYLLGAGFVPARKPGKLPAEKIEESYELEYGTDKFEMHTDAISKGEKVIIIDDLIATGGTIEAIIKLVRRLGGEVVESAFIVELEFLNGRKKLEDLGVEVFSIIKY